MEGETTVINNPWGKGFRSLIVISAVAFFLSEMWEGMAIIAGLTCFAALFSGFVWLVGMADAKQKALRGNTEMFNSTGFQLQQNADGTWGYVMPENNQSSNINQNIEILDSSPDNPIKFKINHLPSSDQAWVGIYPIGASNQDLGEAEERAKRWHWLRDIDANNASFPAQSEGSYSIRVFHDGGYILHSSTEFEITSDSKPEVRMTNARLQGNKLHGTVHEHPKLGDLDNVTSSTIVSNEQIGTTHRVETVNTIYLIAEEDWQTEAITVEETVLAPIENNIEPQAAEVETIESSSKTSIDKKAVTAAAIGAVAGAGTIAALKQKATEQIEIPEQVIEKVRQSGIQPDDLLKFADFNRDGLIDAAELTGAITAATGIAIPFTVLKTIIDKVDSDGDSALNRDELELLWVEMGIPLTKVEETLEEEIDATLEEISEPETIPEEVVEESIDEKIHEEVEENDEEESPEQHIEGTEFEEVELTEGIDTRLEEVLVQLEEARLTSERNIIIEAHGFNHRVTIRIQRVDKTILGDPEYRGGLTFTGELDGGPYDALLEMPVAMTEQLSSFDKGDTVVAIAHLSKWKSGLKRAVLEGVEIIN